jgi:hypothetical protein
MSNATPEDLAEWREVTDEPEYPIEIPYEECIYVGTYMDTIQMEGVGYLFINSIPVELQKDNNVMYIIYNEDDDSTTFSATYPTEAIWKVNKSIIRENFIKAEYWDFK